MESPTMNPPAQQDPFAALGATFEPAQPAAPPAGAPKQPDPFASLGAQFEPAAPAPVAAAPQAPVPPGQPSVRPYNPTLLDAARLSIANSAIGHALETSMPSVADALHLHPTETFGSPEAEQHKQELINPAAFVDNLTQQNAPPTMGNPLGFLVRKDTTEKKTAAQNILSGAAEGVGGLTTAPNLAMMAIPIGEVAGLAGKAGAAILPRLVSAGFSADMIHGLYQQAQQYKQLKAQGRGDEAENVLGQMMVTAPMLFMAGAHAVMGGHGAPSEVPNAETAPAVETGKTETPVQTPEDLAAKPAVEPGKTVKVSDDPFAKLGAQFENSDVVPRGTEAHPPIGETEPETGRPVLQQSPRPEVNQAAATAEHPAIKDTLHEITQPVEGAKVVGARDEKDTDRLEEKMDAEGQSPRTVRDYSGFRISVDSPAARDAVVKQIRSKFEVPNESDEFDSGAEESGFHGHTLQVREPGSPVTHEVQVLPKEVADVAEERHGLYEKAREGDDAAAAELKRLNEEDYQRFVARNTNTETKGGRGESPATAPAPEQPAAEPKFKFGSTQANIPEDSEAAAALKTAQYKIHPSDLAGTDVNGTMGGLETEPHITVRYGIKGDDLDGIRKYISSQAPFEASLGPTDKFPASEHSDGAVPIISPVEAPELHRIEAELDQHGDFNERSFPEYKPHATLGYVKPEAADKYTGMRTTDGKKFTVRSIAISDRNGNIEEIPLKGEPNAGQEPRATQVHQREPQEDGVAGDGRGRVEPGIERPAPAGASLFGEEEAAGAAKPQVTSTKDLTPNTVARVPLSELKADPKRFQYKMNTDASGTTNLLKGRKWNDALAGVVSVWRDPADGQTYVVNGHHRFELAGANGVEHMNVLPIEAPDAPTARSIGALQNIAEGRGTPMDAAKFFRDSGYTPEDLDKIGISMGEATAANGLALAKLDPRIFDDVVNGRLRQNRAIAIGNATDNPEEQEAILKIIEKAESRGRKVSDDTIDELARMAKAAGSHTSTQETLFGAQEMTRNLALEKAEISSYVRDQIGKEKRLFGSVADESKAGRLVAGGNKINAAKNRAIAESAAQAQELYDRLSTKAGNVDDILSRAAQDLAEGSNPAQVKQRTYEAIRGSLSETLGEPAGGKPQRIREAAKGSEETLPAAAQRSQGLKAPEPPARGPKADKWEKGERFLVRNPATGELRAGEVTYYNEGINGSKPGGRSRLADGTKLDEIPSDAIRIRTTEKPIKPVVGTDLEREVIERTKANLPKYVTDYLERFTEGGVPTLATDAAKELYPEFKADPTGADRETAAGGKAIRDSAMATVLAAPIDPKRPEVLITTASPGSGKTTGQAGGGNPDGIGVKIEAISDDYKSFSSLVKQVVDSGRKPVVQWIYVDDPAKTVRRMFMRAVGHGEKPGIGRTVQLKYMADAYTQVPRVLERIREEFGDKVAIHAVDNSGPLGTARVTSDIDPLIEQIKSKPYNQVVEEMQGELQKLKSEGLFDTDRGKAILKAAEANDPATGSDEARGQSGSVSGAVGSGGQEVQGPKDTGPVLDTTKTKGQRTGASSEGGAGSVSPEEFKSGLEEAKKRSLRENAATHQAKAIDTPAGKAVLMDPDAMALWYRSGLGEKVAWRGLSLPKGLANKVELVLRSMAGSARAEAGGADAAVGYDRLVKALREGRNEDGSVTLLRGDYRPDTVLEEAWHNWQRSNRIADSDAMRMVAQRPEIKEIADRLREMGYGVKPGIEGRTELAMEMMAKALAGDPDLHLTEEQRYDLTHSFLSEAVKEFGPEVLKEIPGVTPEAKAAVADARRTYEPDEAGRGATARRENARSGELDKEGSGLGQGARDTGRGGEPAARGDERSDAAAGKEEGELAYQRAKKGAPLRPEDSLALPGMEHVDDEMKSERGLFQAQELTDKMKEPIADISKASGEMERNSPLFAGNDQVNGQGLLFQRGADGNPVAARVQELVDALASEKRDDNRSALEKVADFTGRTFNESTDRAAKNLREMPSRLESAWVQAKLITASLVDGFRHPLKATDWKKSVGQMDLARVETALKLKKLGQAIKDAAPDRLDRIGMTHFIEAGGDPRKLDEWATMAEQRWKQRRGDPDIDPRLKNHLADSVEHYRAATKLTPEQKAIATRIKQHFDDMLNLAKQNGLLEYGARNYVRHLYEAADAADLIKLLDTNEINPNPGFLEKRIFRTYWEAENAGMIPRNKDLGYLVTAYDKSFNQAIASRSMLRSLLDGKGQDGRPLAAIRLRGKWVTVGDDQQPLVLQQRERPNSLAGYKYLDLSPTRNFLFEPTREDLDGYEYDPKLFEEDPGSLAFKGDLIFHPEVAGRIEDMLTPGWFDRNENAAQRIGHKVLTGSALAKEMMTMVAPFHMVQLAEHSVEHWVNPFKLPEIDLDGKTEGSRKQRLLASNGLGLMDFDAEGLFSAKALKSLGEGIPGVNVAMDAVNSLSRWQFEDVIPRMKMKMAMQAFDRNWDKYGSKLEAEQFSRVKDQKIAHETAERMVAELTAKQANAAFGNLNTAFDSIHRSKTFKQMLRLTMFAPDFLESRIRYTAQAFTRYGGEQRAALLRGALGMYVIARVANAMLNNGDTKNDLEHAFTVVADGRNFSLRSQSGDIIHLITDPRGFIYNRLNPMTVRPVVEYLNGRDQFGRQKTPKSQVKDLAKSVLPFGVQKIIQTPDESWLNSILSSFGIVTSNYRSPAEEMTHKLLLRNIPDMPDDPEKQAQSRSIHQLEEAIREGKKKPAEAIQMAKDDKISVRQAFNIIDRSQHSKLYNEFASGSITIVPKHAGDPSALDIYEKATPAERMELRPALITKGENQIPDIRRSEPATSAELRALEKAWKEQAEVDPKFKIPDKVPDARFEVLAALWRSLLASTPHEKGVPPVPGQTAPASAVAQR